jgi:hypothetical protein
MGCGHRFCLSCFSEYLRNQVRFIYIRLSFYFISYKYLEFKVEEGPSCVFSHCPEHLCRQTVTKTVYHRLLKDQTDIDKYDLYFIRNFIEVVCYFIYFIFMNHFLLR